MGLLPSFQLFQQPKVAGDNHVVSGGRHVPCRARVRVFTSARGAGFKRVMGVDMSRLVARACSAHPKVSHQLSLVSSGLTSSSATSPATRTRALTDRWFALHRDARIHRRSLTAWGEAWGGRGSRTDASSLRMRKNQDGSVRANGGDDAESGRGMRADAHRCMRSPAQPLRRRLSSPSGFPRRLRRKRRGDREEKGSVERDYGALAAENNTWALGVEA